MPGLLDKSSPMAVPTHGILTNKTAAPAVKPLHSPPKEVHFPSRHHLVTGISRTFTPREAWSVHHFEEHARHCQRCYNPYQKYKAGQLLCQTGDVLAQDMAVQLYMWDGVVYERLADNRRKPDRVEIPSNHCPFALGQLKVMEKREGGIVMRPHKPKPVFTQEVKPARKSEDRARDDRYYQDSRREHRYHDADRHATSSSARRQEAHVVIEPAQTGRAAKIETQHRHEIRQTYRNEKIVEAEQRRDIKREEKYREEKKRAEERQERHTGKEYLKEAKRHLKDLERTMKYKTEIRRPQEGGREHAYERWNDYHY